MNQERSVIDKTQARKQVVIVAMTGHMLLDFAGPADVFNSANKVLEAEGLAGGYDVLVAAPTVNKRVTNSVGIEINCAYSVQEIATRIDTVLIAGSNNILNIDDPAYQEFYDWLATVNRSARRLGSICAGAFALAVGSSRVDLQACKLEYSIVSPK